MCVQWLRTICIEVVIEIWCLEGFKRGLALEVNIDCIRAIKVNARHGSITGTDAVRIYQRR